MVFDSATAAAEPTTSSPSGSSVASPPSPKFGAASQEEAQFKTASGYQPEIEKVVMDALRQFAMREVRARAFAEGASPACLSSCDLIVVGLLARGRLLVRLEENTMSLNRRRCCRRTGLSVDDVDNALDDAEERGMLPKESIIITIMRQLRRTAEQDDGSAATSEMSKERALVAALGRWARSGTGLAYDRLVATLSPADTVTIVKPALAEQDMQTSIRSNATPENEEPTTEEQIDEVVTKTVAVAKAARVGALVGLPGGAASAGNAAGAEGGGGSNGTEATSTSLSTFVEDAVAEEEQAALATTAVTSSSLAGGKKKKKKKKKKKTKKKGGVGDAEDVEEAAGEFQPPPGGAAAEETGPYANYSLAAIASAVGATVEEMREYPKEDMLELLGEELFMVGPLLRRRART